MTRLRARRAYFGQVTTAMAMMAFRVLAPSMPATAMASTRPGKAIIMSATRMITASTQPPKYPASMPRKEPITNTTATSMNVEDSDVRAPYSTRTKMSRPILSVPKGCSALGGMMDSFRLPLMGFTPRLSWGANTATSTSSTANTAKMQKEGYLCIKRFFSMPSPP